MAGLEELNVFWQCSTALEIGRRQRCNFTDRRQWQERREAEHSNPTDYAVHCHLPKCGSREFMKSRSFPVL